MCHVLLDGLEGYQQIAQVSTKLPGGCAKGELTLAGQQQALEFGQWLRKRYIDQLGLLSSAYKV